MFIRSTVITSLNGFEKVSQTEKRRLASVLNTMSADINKKANATIELLDCVYRSDIFNTESAVSMERYNSLIKKLKAVKTAGITIEIFEIEEQKFADLPDNGKYVRACAESLKSFEI